MTTPTTPEGRRELKALRQLAEKASPEARQQALRFVAGLSKRHQRIAKWHSEHGRRDVGKEYHRRAAGFAAVVCDLERANREMASVVEDANLYFAMLRVAKENGFDSLTDAITVAVRAEASEQREAGLKEALNRARDGLAALEEIEACWDAYGTAGNRNNLSLSEQIASTLRELEDALHDYGNAESECKIAEARNEELEAALAEANEARSILREQVATLTDLLAPFGEFADLVEQETNGFEYEDKVALALVVPNGGGQVEMDRIDLGCFYAARRQSKEGGE